MSSLPFVFDKIPDKSILGVCYSGMHDTSIAIVAPSGDPIYAVSLERVSRVKQDGRSPERLIRDLPWSRIDRVALSVSGKEKRLTTATPSKTHPLPLNGGSEEVDLHGDAFYRVLDLFPRDVVHVPHHLSHAASAFWGSGFNSALCLVYDGGMSNEDCFGGLYNAQLGTSISEVDRFSCAIHANVTHLYSAVTAVLGFRPQKHEGKITGLAAYGRPNARCGSALLNLLASRELNGLFSWRNLYSDAEAPELVADQARLEHLRRLLSDFSREDIAATVQHIAEEHVLEILRRASATGLAQPSICLSGGLFSNVKVNQRVADLGFDNFFVSPAMTDDGTALGAAWHVHSLRDPGLGPRVPSMYLGPASVAADSKALIGSVGVHFSKPPNPARKLAQLLAAGKLVALFQGASEFGPRALGNRSILAQATDSSINDTLNKRLRRTEFMPFAPIVRVEDASMCFELRDSVVQACHFMTVTVPCTQRLKQECPAVVHVDGTARPQLVSAQTNHLAHSVLSHYVKATAKLALVNTSFNVHEEPIVCTIDDALRGFFEAGLDYLYVDGVGLIDRLENQPLENQFLREKLAVQSQRLASLMSEVSSTAPAASSAASLFLSGDALRPYVVEGFHAAEAWGAWSSGRHSRIVLPVNRSGHGPVELHLTMTLTIFEGLLASAPVIAIHVDGRWVGVALFRAHGARSHHLSFYVRSESNTCEIAFDLSHSTSPFVAAQSSDKREIGFGLSGFGMTISAAGDRAPYMQVTSPLPWFVGA